MVRSSVLHLGRQGGGDPLQDDGIVVKPSGSGEIWCAVRLAKRTTLFRWMGNGGARPSIWPEYMGAGAGWRE
jgi:hypothetical protein